MIAGQGCQPLKGQPSMIWGRPGGNREKKFGGPSPGEKIVKVHTRGPHDWKLCESVHVHGK